MSDFNITVAFKWDTTCCNVYYILEEESYPNDARNIQFVCKIERITAHRDPRKAQKF